MIRHVSTLIEGSPLPLKFAKAESDVARIKAALRRLAVLEMRSRDALTVIRLTPRVPPDLVTLRDRIGREIAEFRRTSRTH